MSAAVLAIDFAPRHSAAALMDAQGTLIDFWPHDAGAEAAGFRSATDALQAWCLTLSEAVKDYESITLVIEDVPGRTIARPELALRLQGALRVLLGQSGFADPVMVGPSTWQNFYGWRKTEGMTSKGFAKFACTVLGYTFEGTTGKQTVDVRDAVLIARWAVETLREEEQ